MTISVTEDKTFLFSIVVAVYNAEDYLEETIESLIGQTISFEENIQVILVDDGSTDGSLKICERYAERYPNNIEVHAKENGGVSSARNLGIRFAVGRYVNFLDSDDLWAPDALEIVRDFFNDNPKVKVAAARIKEFGRTDDYHILDYKFEQTRVVNIFAEWDCPQLSAATAFFDADVVKRKQFPPIAIGEDFLFTSSIITELGLYGVVREAEYLYRKQQQENSAMDSARESENYYTDTLKVCHNVLFALSRELYGYIIPYVQNAVMYDLQWRIASPAASFFEEAMLLKYESAIAALLADISDEVIVAQRNMSNRKKIAALALKEGVPYRDKLEQLVYSDLCEAPLYKPLFRRAATIEFISVRDEAVVFEGFCDSVIFPELGDVCAVTSGEHYYAEIVDRPEFSESTFYDVDFARRKGFRIEVPRGKTRLIEFRIENKHNTGSGRMSLSFAKFCKLANKVPSSYFFENGCAIVSRAGHQIRIIEHPSFLQLVKREASFDRRIAKSPDGGIGVVARRLSAIVDKWLHKNSMVCLVSDRPTKADDNGEHFFKWLIREGSGRLKPYFVIKKDSPDFDRMKKIGPVVDPDSKKYDRLFLRARFIVSSSFGGKVYQNFGDTEQFFRGLYSFKYVFLQHGVTQNDISNLVGRYASNASLFVCASYRERSSILELPYHYDESTVVLSGFPRHDNLRINVDPAERRIMLAPTWRSSLSKGFDPDDGGAIVLEEDFLHSDYYKAFVGLIQDERLVKHLRDNGFVLDFVVHPGFARCAYLFPESDVVRIVSECNYNEEFKKASILITDYSSVAFDFALLGKPVVYFQYDEDTYYGGGHWFKKGYFDTRRDGFGPVLNGKDDVVDYVIGLIDNDCAIEESYLQRVKDFFFNPPQGSSSSAIIYDAMLNLR